MAFPYLKSRGISLMQSRAMATSTSSAKPVGIIRSTFASYGETRIIIGMIGGFVGLAIMFAAHTAKQQLLHNPNVQVTKKKRESMPEVDIPDTVLRSADKFLDKSILRKVGHIRDNAPTTRRASEDHETLKSVGVGK